MTATLTKKQIKARNRPIREMFDGAARDGEINIATNWFLHAVLDYCGANEYTNAKRSTFARLLNKSLSTIKNYLRSAVEAGLVWVEEHTHSIWISALVPPPQPEPEVVQLSLLDDAGGAKNCPESGKKLPSQLKEVNPGFNPRGGGSAQSAEANESHTDNQDWQTEAPVNSEAAYELRRAGMVAEEVIRDLATHPIDRVRAVIAYVKRQRRAGPGLIASMLRKNTPIPIPAAHPAPQRPADPPAVKIRYTIEEEIRLSLAKRIDDRATIDAIEAAARARAIGGQP